MLSGARGGVIASTGGLSGAAVPTPLGLCAAVAFGSPEAASCGLTLTNTAQELRLGGCKLFSSSREKSSRRRAGGVWAAAPCHVPPPLNSCAGSLLPPAPPGRIRAAPRRVLGRAAGTDPSRGLCVHVPSHAGRCAQPQLVAGLQLAPRGRSGQEIKP